MKIFLGADHRGFELKGKLKEWLKDHGYGVEDLGARKLDPGDDYPDYAIAVAEKVAEAPNDYRGILICGAGHGMDIAANKVRGIRATVVWNTESVARAREHNDVNIISIPADWTQPEPAKEMVKIFLETPFSDEERHARRLKKIQEIEKRSFSAEGGSAFGGK